MYYRKALVLQAFLDMAKEDGNNLFYFIGRNNIHLILIKNIYTNDFLSN
jgi:hypothetical protein